MARKTIVIEFIVNDETNHPNKRDEVTRAVGTDGHELREALIKLGWSGNRNGIAVTVSNPKRTAHWPE